MKQRIVYVKAYLFCTELEAEFIRNAMQDAADRKADEFKIARPATGSRICENTEGVRRDYLNFTAVEKK